MREGDSIILTPPPLPRLEVLGLIAGLFSQNIT